MAPKKKDKSLAQNTESTGLSELAGQIKDNIDAAVEVREERVEFISTGCIPFNLALSQKGKNGGIARGRIINFVGDGSSGKTLNALETAAWYWYNILKVKSNLYPDTKKRRVRYNNGEGVMDFPVAEMYGDDFYDGAEWIQINEAEAWGLDVQRSINELKKGESMLYICDSLDSLIPQASKERIEKQIKNGGKRDGTYGLEAQKYFSTEFFNDLCDRMTGKDFTLLIISQVRENLSAGIFGKKYRRNGGKALDFYTHQVAWLYSREKFKKTFKGNERIYGVSTLAKVERNKTALPYREAEIPIMFDFGVDNNLACASFLFGAKDKEIEWEGETMKKSDLVELADNDEFVESKLAEAVEQEWFYIEDNVRSRKPSKAAKYMK